MSHNSVPGCFIFYIRAIKPKWPAEKQPTISGNDNTTQQHLIPYSACEVNKGKCCCGSMSTQGFPSRGVRAIPQSLS